MKGYLSRFGSLIMRGSAFHLTLLVVLSLCWLPAQASALDATLAPSTAAVVGPPAWQLDLNRGVRLQRAGRNTLLVSAGWMATAFGAGIATPLTQDEARQDRRRILAYSAAGASALLLIPSVTLLMRGRTLVKRSEKERGIDAMFAPSFGRGGAGANFYLRY